MRLLILTLSCLLFITTAQAGQDKSIQADQIAQQLKTQEEQLDQIAQQTSLERLRIEAWYKRQLTELRNIAEQKARQLKLDDRALWSEFVKMTEGTPFFDAYFKRSTTVFTRNAQSYDLHAALVDSYFLSAVTDLLMDPDFCKYLANLADGSPYNPQSLLIRQQARKLLYLANDIQSKLDALQHRRAVRLAAIEQRTQVLKEDVVRVMREIKAAPETVNVGMVSAIMYNQNLPQCMVDGVDKILKEGDSIGDIKVVKISPDQVEFVKASQTWMQKVGKPANAAWK